MKAAAATLVILSILAVPAAVQAQNDEVAIVGHPGTTPESIAAKDLARIFLKKKTKWPDGRAAEPVDQKRAPELRRVFSEQILGMSVDMVESHWQAQVFSGRNTPPLAFASDAEVLDYVRRTPGAVGYVSGATSTSGVKLIRVVN